MRRGFWNGVLIGGFLGVALALWLSPSARDEFPGEMRRRGRRAADAAQKFWRQGREMAEDAAQRLMS